MAVEYCLLLNNNKLINCGQTKPSTISAMPNFTASLTTGICLLVIFSPVMPEYHFIWWKHYGSTKHNGISSGMDG